MTAEKKYKCSACSKRFPERMIQPILVAASHRKVEWNACPICALKIRNRAAGLPKDTPFAGPQAKALHDEAVAYLKASGL